MNMDEHWGVGVRCVPPKIGTAIFHQSIPGIPGTLRQQQALQELLLNSLPGEDAKLGALKISGFRWAC